MSLSIITPKEISRIFKKPFKYIYSRVKYPKMGMCILGDKFSGKTCLYSYFVNKKKPLKHRDEIDPNASSSYREIDEFTMQSSSGITLQIEKGRDITGAKEKVFRYYKDMIDRNSLIVYLFNSDEFSTQVTQRKHIVKLIYCIALLINSKEIDLENKLKDLSQKKELTSAEKKDLKRLKYSRKIGTNVIIVPTWKSKCKSDEVDIKNILIKELQKDDLLNKKIVLDQGGHVKICNMYEFVVEENGKEKLNIESLRMLEDEIVKFYTENLKSNLG